MLTSQASFCCKWRIYIIVRKMFGSWMIKYNNPCYLFQSIWIWIWISVVLKGHFTHEPRAVTMKLWEPKRKCPQVAPRHLQNHVVWSRILNCSVKPYVTGPSINCYFNEFYSCGFSHMMKQNKPTVMSIRTTMVSWFYFRLTSKRWLLKIVQMNMKHDPFDAM